MNSVVLIGRLTRDPEVRYTASQMAVATFTLAVDRPVRSGEERKADFIRITCFGKTAELVERYITKGRQVAVQGRIQTGSYQNKDGQTVYTTDVVADRVEFIGSANGNGQQSSQGGFDPFGGSSAPSAPSNDVPPGFDALDDDIPF